MRAQRNPIDYLKGILDAMEKVEIFIAEMDYEAFAEDDKTIFAVIRGMEIIGEATKKIPTKMRTSYPEIPWRSMAGMRDKLIHDYVGVDVLVVWRTATEELRKYRPELERILSEYD